MGYDTKVREYEDWLSQDIPATAGASAFIAAGTVALQAGGFQRLSGADSSIFMNDKGHFLGKELLRVIFIAKMSGAPAGSDAAILGVGGANAAIGSIDPVAQFHIDNTRAIKVQTLNGGTLTEAATGITLQDTWKRFEIDYYSGVQSIVPGESQGGLGSILFSCENDQGQLVPLARGAYNFSLAGTEDAAHQILAKVAAAGGAQLDVRDVTVECRVQP